MKVPIEMVFSVYIYVFLYIWHIYRKHHFNGYFHLNHKRLKSCTFTCFRICLTMRCNYTPYRKELFTLEELKRVGGRLKANTATGIDKVPNGFLKEVIVVYPEILLEAFNSCLWEGKVGRKSLARRRPSARMEGAETSRNGRRDGMVTNPGNGHTV